MSGAAALGLEYLAFCYLAVMWSHSVLLIKDLGSGCCMYDTAMKRIFWECLNSYRGRFSKLHADFTACVATSFLPGGSGVE